MGAAVLRPASKPVINPFLDEYTRQEIEFFGLKEFKKTYGETTIEVKTLLMPTGQVEDFLNRNFRICQMPYPHLFINGTMWMSLSYMEAQSHYVPIQEAHGAVAVLGLGLGYYVLRIMQAPEVDSVDVYELEPAVVEYFTECFGDRPGFDKLSFIEGDARELMVGKEYDYAYSDIYLKLLGDEFETDITRFQGSNDIGMYHPWGIERVFLDAMVQYGMAPATLTMPTSMRAFFKFYLTTEIDLGRGCIFKPSELPKLPLDREFVEEVLDRLEWPIWEL